MSASRDPVAAPWGEATLVDASLAAGDRTLPVCFGKYRVRCELARGGMGTVYLAHTEGPGGFEKPVAIKTTRSEFAGEPRLAELFLREARIASRLSHPNVCSVFDFGEQSGTYYIAMEWLVGEPLSRVMNRLATEAVLRADERRYVLAAKLVADACEGLRAAHELADASGEPLGIVHRDVSPQNIFVSYDGSVRIMDFGIARATRELTLTAAGMVRGKLGYLAPEQLRSGARVDQRVDLWALGVVLWELIALERLFETTSPTDSVQAIREKRILAPSSVARGAPHELDEIVLRALVREPANRFASAREMGRELTEFLGRHPPQVALAEIGDWMRRVFPDGQRRQLEIADAVTSRELAPGPVATTGTATLSGAADGAPHAEPARRWRLRRRRVGAAIAAACAVAGSAFAIATTWKSSVQSSRNRPSGAPASTARAPATITAPEPRATPEPRTAPEPFATPEPRVDPASGKAPTHPRPPHRGQRVAAQTEVGRVAIVTTGGWATISLRGSSFGQSPLTFRLPTGTHRLTLRPFDGPSAQTVTVVVRRDEITRLVVPIASP